MKYSVCEWSLSPAKMKAWKSPKAKLILDLFHDFSEYFPFVVEAGGLLGSVRHHGLIPYDADLDLSMNLNISLSCDTCVSNAGHEFMETVRKKLPGKTCRKYSPRYFTCFNEAKTASLDIVITSHNPNICRCPMNDHWALCPVDAVNKVAKLYGPNWNLPISKSLFLEANLSNLSWFSLFNRHIRECDLHYYTDTYMMVQEDPDLFDLMLYLKNNSYISSYVLNNEKEILYPVWLNTNCTDSTTLQFMSVHDRTNYALTNSAMMCGHSEQYYTDKMLKIVKKKWKNAFSTANVIHLGSSQTRLRISMFKDNRKRDHGWKMCSQSVKSDGIAHKVYFSKWVPCNNNKCNPLGKTLTLNKEFYKSHMKALLTVFDRRVPNTTAGFSGLKNGAKVFWRNYPEYVDIDSIVGEFKNIHLLDVKNMQRESSKICNVFGGPKSGQVYCDRIHYCVGTVQRAWNYVLARFVLYNGTNIDTQGSFVFSNSSTYTNCDPKLCNGFQINLRYKCPEIHSERNYKFILKNQPQFNQNELFLAFKGKKICFGGDSLSRGQAETLSNTMYLKFPDSNTFVEASGQSRSGYFLNRVVSHGKGLYTKTHDLYIDIIETGLKDLKTCDVIVLNTALFWQLEGYKKREKKTIGRIFSGIESFNLDTGSVFNL